MAIAILLSIIVIILLSNIIVAIMKEKSEKLVNNLEHELQEVVMICEELQEKGGKGIGVFTPVEKDKYLYDILVERGIMSINKLGGYSFKEDHDRLWSKQQDFKEITKPANYQDDDGILQSGIEQKGGKIVRKMTKEENGKLVKIIITEIDGEVVNTTKEDIKK